MASDLMDVLRQELAGKNAKGSDLARLMASRPEDLPIPQERPVRSPVPQERPVRSPIPQERPDMQAAGTPMGNYIDMIMGAAFGEENIQRGHNANSAAAQMQGSEAMGELAGDLSDDVNNLDRSPNYNNNSNNGNQSGDRNPEELTDKELADIESLASDGWSMREIATAFGIAGGSAALAAYMARRMNRANQDNPSLAAEVPETQVRETQAPTQPTRPQAIPDAEPVNMTPPAEPVNLEEMVEATMEDAAEETGNSGGVDEGRIHRLMTIAEGGGFDSKRSLDYLKDQGINVNDPQVRKIIMQRIRDRATAAAGRVAR